jgi:hypothetical protein
MRWRARLPLTGMASNLPSTANSSSDSDVDPPAPGAGAQAFAGQGAAGKAAGGVAELHLGRPLRLEIAVAEPAARHPAERSRNAQRERQEKAIASIEQDPFVRDVVDLFDASIDESTIKPV